MRAGTGSCYPSYIFPSQGRPWAAAVTTATDLVVDHSDDATFQINFKLELPSLSCEWATVVRPDTTWSPDRTERVSIWSPDKRLPSLSCEWATVVSRHSTRSPHQTERASIWSPYLTYAAHATGANAEA